ncbi:TonB-dependent receptor [Galbibacter sp. BG1]|uniref:SusC/RagA family TonB-linked outer membrane protein n=1 Tax=Galbibacter sp. BG1 TaxID=1170699 RepID=UPI0015B7BD66|nr:TonB-dependent receptor [Galbibacter sp. BG1]QLE02192.1 TonB-dependent receptor [Galbibacter sp. BG1]
MTFKIYTKLTVCMLMFFGFSSLSAQEITGNVTDENNTPLPGANVVVKGTTNGTQTDFDGNYTITVPSNDAVLVFSYIGYNSQEISVSGKSSIDVTLQPDIASLDEVVVIGYGTQERSDVSGAVSTVSSEALEGRPVADFQNALQGQVAGLQITNSSGAPGGATSVRIRGTGSITGGSAPLYVVDGNIISAGVGNTQNDPFATINPSDIESINVLKDASAAAIYGARAANGVIIITTKRGKSGKPRINFNTFAGFQDATNTLDLLNAQQYQSVMNTVRDNAGQPRIPNLDGTTLTESTDWQDAVLRSGAVSSYELNASGGSDYTNFYMSLSHYDEKGVVIGTGFKRTSFRINSDTELGRLKIGNSLTVSRSTYDKEFRANGRSILYWALANSPAIPIYNENNVGGYNGPTGDDGDTGVLNPVAAQNLIDNESIVNRILGNVYAEVDLLKDLTYRINFGADISSFRNNLFAPYFVLTPGEAVVGLPNGAQVDNGNGENVSLLLENTLQYKKQLGNHNIDLLAGYTVQDDERVNTSVTTVGQNISDDFPVISGSSESPIPPSGVRIEERTVSYIGRVLYNYDRRYLATFNFRRDGSSIFTGDNLFDNFLSGSVGWVISKEAFMENSVFSNLKLRASYGFLGNDQINANATTSILNTNPRYVFGSPQAVISAVAPDGQLANPGLTWEKQEQLNIGLDFGLFKNRFTMSADYFIKTSNDLLLKFQLPDATGFEEVFINAAEVENKGLELIANFNDTKGDFSYGVSANVTFLDNNVNKLAEGLEAIESESSNEFPARRRIEPGNSLFSFYGYQADGIYQTQEEIDNGPTPYDNSVAPGDLRFRDLSGPDGTPDGRIDENDRTFIGDANLDFQYGFTFNMGYEGFDFSAQFQGVAGNEIFSDTKFYTQGYYRTNNLTTDVLNAWTPTNQNNTTPRAIPSTNSNNDLPSSFFVEDGSYLRLKNLQVGYNLNQNTLNAIGLAKMRVYFAGQNVFTITDYSGFDPEVGLSGFDNVQYPQSRRFTVGLQLGF